MRDFNEIKTALWLNNITYSYVNYSYSKNKYFDEQVDGEKVHSLAELCYRYRTDISAASSSVVNVRYRHRSPILKVDTNSGMVNPKGLQALVNDICSKYPNYRVYHFTNTNGSTIIRLSATYKSLWKTDDELVVPVTIFYEWPLSKNHSTVNFQTSSVIGIATKELSFSLSKEAVKDIYFGIPTSAYSSTNNGVEILNIEPLDEWKDADKKEEKVLHKFSYVVNISANPAVLKVYARNDAIEKCSLDADKYVDTDLNKVVYTATYANGATATIDFWSYDENEELIVYQLHNCTLGEKIQSW